MVTENNDYVSEGPNNDQMKYLLYAYTLLVLHTFDCRLPPLQSGLQKPPPAAIVFWSGGQMR